MQIVLYSPILMKKTFFVASLCAAMSANATDVIPKQSPEDPTDSIGWSKTLDEVVVTGQGISIQKRRLSTNVATVKSAQLEKLSGNRIDELLQTAVPNMQINLSNGQPGAASVMRSRGVSSVQINGTPVIYVDGVRMDNNNTATSLAQKLNEQGVRAASASGSLADLPMENIERIEYVNGGAATTLYGSDAANGVIQIFTKKGGKGPLKAMAEVQLGWEEANAQFYHFRRSKEVLNQTGLTTRYRIGLDAGGKLGGWSLGASAAMNEGVIVSNNNRNHKYDVRFGSHLNILPNLTYSGSVGFVHNDYMRSRNGNEGYYSGLWLTECGAASSMTYTGGNGEAAAFNTNIDAMGPEEFGQFKHLIATSERLQDKRTDINRVQMSHELKYEPIEHLLVKGVFGLDHRYETMGNNITDELIALTKYNGPLMQANHTSYKRNFNSLTFDVNAQYTTNFSSLVSSVSTVGYQYFYNADRQYYKHTVAENITTDGNRSSLYNHGVYMNENIGLANRYFVDLGLRGDYNSGFGQNVGWQWYPKVGLSYILTAEKWMAPLVEAGIIGNTRFFTNFGVAGNYPPAFAYQKTVTFYPYNRGEAAGYGQYGNPDLRPEKKYSYEVGMSTQLFGGYFSAGVTYYNATTRDALFSVHTSPSTGQNSTYLANIGKIRNEGFEFTIGSDFLQTDDWHASFNASLNTLKNKVLSTGGEIPFGIGTFAGEAIISNMVAEGKPIGYLRGNKAVIDENGNYVRTEQLQDLGSVLPDFYGSLSLNVDYKNLSVYANADYSVGGVVYELDRHFRYRYGLADAAVPEEWNGGAEHKKTWNNFTDRFIESASYLKIRTIGASYTLDVNKAVRALTFSFNCYNPFALIKAQVDPEACLSDAASYGGASIGGIVYGSYSRPRQFVGSIKINF